MQCFGISALMFIARVLGLNRFHIFKKNLVIFKRAIFVSNVMTCTAPGVEVTGIFADFGAQLPVKMTPQSVTELFYTIKLLAEFE